MDLQKLKKEQCRKDGFSKGSHRHRNLQSSSLAFLLARPFYVLYSFCTMPPAQHAMSEDPMDIDLQPEVEEIEPRGPKPIHRLTKDVINQIAAAEVRPRRVGNVF